MTELMHILRALVRDELRSLRLGDVGVITSIFPHAEGDTHNYEVNVKLRDAERELRQLGSLQARRPPVEPRPGDARLPEGMVHDRHQVRLALPSLADEDNGPPLSGPDGLDGSEHVDGGVGDLQMLRRRRLRTLDEVDRRSFELLSLEFLAERQAEHRVVPLRTGGNRAGVYDR